MKKNKMPFYKYSPYQGVSLSGRSWPDNRITTAPVWCSVDLRDGNQALPTPMSINGKLEMFKMLVTVGFKEIEVAFPSASQVEFDFVRCLIEKGHIPNDVTIQVLTQAREHLIGRTFEAIKGAKNAIVHLYNSTSTAQREIVFCKDKKGITKIATDAASLMAELRNKMGKTNIRFEYSPESFTGTEPDYALEICQAVMDILKPTTKNKMIINLPSTVEMSTPNLYADSIEWFLRNIKNRESVILSVHTHNDRGTAVAAAELAVMAGANRVEGSLFGNGERTGNMDILIMALNLFSQGVDPKLNLSNVDQVREIYSRCTRMKVHSRHPYAGELVYTAFSGSHQDAINKGFKAQGALKNKPWNVPYLPIDPSDVGRNYESIIRINSQSGKGGVSYVMEKDWGFHIPKQMQADFALVIQKKTEIIGRELSSEEIITCFRQVYLSLHGTYQLKSCSVQTGNDGRSGTEIHAVIRKGLQEILIMAKGNGPVDAFVRGLRKQLKIPAEVVMYEEHALASGADAEAAAYIGTNAGDGKVVFGAGVDVNISTASIKAILSAVNRLS